MALVEPSRPGPVAGDHAQEPDQGLAVAVRDDGARPMPDRPSVGDQAPRQVDVATGADALDEAAQGLERRPPNEHVPGHRRPAVGPQQAVGLAEESPRPRVSRQEPSLRRIPDDLAAKGAAALADRLGEVGLEKVGRRHAVGIHEQEPLVMGPPGTDVSRVVGGALAGRPDGAHRSARQPIKHAGAGVVGDDQLIACPQPHARQRIEQPPRVVALAEERHHHADRRPPVRRLWPSPSCGRGLSQWASRGRRRTPSRRGAGAPHIGAAGPHPRPRPRTGS